MYAKIEISGTLEVLTGMHIGASSVFAAIGAVDSPVIRDSITDLPLIPGSSLKGKLRTLLAKKYNQNISSSHDNDAEEILRLFGSAKKNRVKQSRLLFSDMILSNMDEMKNNGLNSATEIKFENTINRATAVANPRQIERTIRGAKFPLSLIYNAEEKEEIVGDMKLLAEGLELLKYDYLGGHGSRGYGRVALEGITLKVVTGEVDEALLKECENIVKEV